MVQQPYTPLDQTVLYPLWLPEAPSLKFRLLQPGSQALTIRICVFLSAVAVTADHLCDTTCRSCA